MTRLILSVFLALTVAVPSLAADGPKKKKAAVKKKGYDYERSKYKSRALSESTQSSYRFNEKGEPVTGAKKKPAAKKKVRSEPPEEAFKPEPCGSEERCVEKKADADAL